MKATSLLSYMLKIPYFPKHLFKYNKYVQYMLLKYVCICEEWQEWRSGIIDIIYYLDVDTSKYQGVCLIQLLWNKSQATPWWIMCLLKLFISITH